MMVLIYRIQDWREKEFSIWAFADTEFLNVGLPDGSEMGGPEMVERAQNKEQPIIYSEILG